MVVGCFSVIIKIPCQKSYMIYTRLIFIIFFYFFCIYYFSCICYRICHISGSCRSGCRSNNYYVFLPDRAHNAWRFYCRKFSSLVRVVIFFLCKTFHRSNIRGWHSICRFDTCKICHCGNNRHFCYNHIRCYIRIRRRV